MHETDLPQAEMTGEDLTELGAKWIERIRKRVKDRDDGWGKDAEAAERAYTNDETSTHGKTYAFNILHSNVETIVPSIFNSMPVPDIRERYRQGDGVARVAADLLERAISVQIDDNRLDTEIEQVAQSAFLAGQGILRIRFDADEKQDGEGNVYAVNERVSYEVWPWRDYIEGRATRFDRVTWVAFRTPLPREEVERIGNEDLLGKQVAPPIGDDKNNDIVVWEVWDKHKREVLFIRDDDSRVLEIMPDPLGLDKFFPVCEPVQPITVAGRREPVVPFRVYRKLADEIDKTTKRINAILSGLKVCGIIVGSAGDIVRLAEAEDNQLIPVAGLEGLAQTGGLSKAIEWWPIDQAVAVLQQLYEARDRTKQAIYEITGISDIVRGASDPRETMGAQQIKTQWGSLRIKRLQTLMARLARDAFVLTAELIGSKFSAETLQTITGMRIEDQVWQLVSDPLSHYRIDIESDSTIRSDLSMLKGEMAEFLQGTAAYFQTMQPVVAQAPEIAGPIVALYASFARQFNLGRQAEDALDELIEMAKQSAAEPRPNPEAEAKAKELEMKAQESQAKIQEGMARLGINRAAGQATAQLKGRELDLKERALELDGLKKLADMEREAG